MPFCSDLNCLIRLVLSCYVLTFVAGRALFPGSPIILVPGDGGSQFYAKLNKSHVVHYVCSKQTNAYFPLWLSLELLIPPFNLDCFVDNMRLVYNTTSRTTSNSPGVDIQIPGWGMTNFTEYIDQYHIWLSEYFGAIVQAAVGWGYTRNKDIRGAPYDFRKAPNEMSEFYANMTKLIEETYYYNQNKPVTIIGHSMGNPVMLYFYNTKPQAWKDKFLKAHISIGGPWGGSMKILKVFASGYNLDHYRLILPPLKLRPEQRSMTSSAFLLPTDKFWNDSEVLVVTDKRNYTVKDYQAFFNDMNYSIGYMMYEDVKDYIYDLTPPNVEMHCLYGTGYPTPEQYIYGPGEFPDTQPTIMYGPGDGTVNLRSLRGCMRWVKQQKQPVYEKAFPNQEHLRILYQSTELIDYIKGVVLPNRTAHHQNQE